MVSVNNKLQYNMLKSLTFAQRISVKLWIYPVQSFVPIKRVRRHTNKVDLTK